MSRDDHYDSVEEGQIKTSMQLHRLLVLSVIDFCGAASIPVSPSIFRPLSSHTLPLISQGANRTNLSASQTWGIAPYQVDVDNGGADSVRITEFGRRPASQYKDSILQGFNDILIIVQRMGDSQGRMITGVLIGGPVQVQFTAVSPAGLGVEVRRKEYMSFIEAIRARMVAEGPIEIRQARLVTISYEQLALGGSLSIRYPSLWPF